MPCRCGAGGRHVGSGGDEQSLRGLLDELSLGGLLEEGLGGIEAEDNRCSGAIGIGSLGRARRGHEAAACARVIPLGSQSQRHLWAVSMRRCRKPIDPHGSLSLTRLFVSAWTPLISHICYFSTRIPASVGDVFLP